MGINQTTLQNYALLFLKTGACFLANKTNKIFLYLISEKKKQEYYSNMKLVLFLSINLLVCSLGYQNI